MNRRKFLRNAGLIGLPVMASPINLPFAKALSALANPESDRVLVLIQLSGGNDGLNTLVPLDQYANLTANRAALMLPESAFIGLTDTLALHPNMEGFANLYNGGKLGAVQAVGYPNQNRSHFRSTDIWTSGSAADVVDTRGWMGRKFTADFPEYPEGYPNQDHPDPFAIAMGSQVSQTCQGVGTNFSMALNDPFNITSLVVGGDTAVPDTPYGEELAFLRTTIGQSNAYGTVVQQAAENGNSITNYPDNAFANALKNIAYLISGGLKTSVYVVNLGGFDTHANQVVDGDSLNGEHAELLRILSEGMEAFHNDLAALGIEDRVLSMTFSEFGRRIAANDSLGTDHGSAAPLFLMGTCVMPGFLGANPEIPAVAAVDEGVAMQYDFRDVYASVLQDWFEIEAGEVANILGREYNYLPIIRNCNLPSANQEDYLQAFEAKVYPNPFATAVKVSFHSNGGHTDLAIFDLKGQLVKQVFSKHLNAGQHEISIDLPNLPATAYTIRLQSGATVVSRRVLKMQ